MAILLQELLLNEDETLRTSPGVIASDYERENVTCSHAERKTNTVSVFPGSDKLITITRANSIIESDVRNS